MNGPAAPKRSRAEKFEDLQQRLDEAGVDNLERFMWELGDEANVDACLNAVAEARSEGVSKRLLAHRVKVAARSGYVPPESQAATASSEITPRLIETVRRGCCCPDGMTREEARGLYAEAAKRRGVAPDVLIDAAMGADWQGREAA